MLNSQNHSTQSKLQFKLSRPSESAFFRRATRAPGFFRGQKSDTRCAREGSDRRPIRGLRSPPAPGRSRGPSRASRGAKASGGVRHALATGSLGAAPVQRVGILGGLMRSDWWLQMKPLFLLEENRGRAEVACQALRHRHASENAQSTRLQAVKRRCHFLRHSWHPWQVRVLPWLDHCVSSNPSIQQRFSKKSSKV